MPSVAQLLRLRTTIALALVIPAIIATAAQTNAITETLDGQFHTGTITLHSNAVTISPPSKPPVHIPLSQIKELTFTGNTVAAPDRNDGTGVGLLGYYYHNTNLLGQPLTRLDQTVDFTWKAHHHPHPDFDKNYFSVRWMGYIEPPRTDHYEIHFGSDDGGRFWIDDRGPFSLWQRQEYAESKARLLMEKGKRYKIRIEYFEAFGNARARLWWSSPRLPKTIIPSNRLHPSSFLVNHPATVTSNQGLLATYNDDPDFNGHSFTRTDPNVDATWKHPPIPLRVRAIHKRWVDARSEHIRATTALATFQAQHQLNETDDGEQLFDRNRARAKRALDQTLKKFERIERHHRELESSLLKDEMSDDERSQLRRSVIHARIKSDKARAECEVAGEAYAAFQTIANLEDELKQTSIDAKNAFHRARNIMRDASIPLDKEIAPGIPANFFGIRWSGQLIAEENAEHTFYIETDEPIRVWFNDRLVIDQHQSSEQTTFNHSLQAGAHYPIRIEARNTDRNGTAKLYWSTPKTSKTVVPKRAFIASHPATTSDEVDRSPVKFAPGVALENGTYVQSPIRKADETAIHFDGVLANQSVPLVRATRIHIRAMTPAQLGQLQPGRTGVLLVNRDFVEGQFVGMEDGKLKISSVLFGLATFDVSTQVSVVVLRNGLSRRSFAEAEPGLPGPYEVNTTDGTTIHATNIQSTPNGIHFPGTSLHIPIHALTKVAQTFSTSHVLRSAGEGTSGPRQEN